MKIHSELEKNNHQKSLSTTDLQDSMVYTGKHGYNTNPYSTERLKHNKVMDP